MDFQVLQESDITISTLFKKVPYRDTWPNSQLKFPSHYKMNASAQSYILLEKGLVSISASSKPDSSSCPGGRVVHTSVRKVKTSLNSFVVFMRRLFSVSTTVVECSLLCFVLFTFSFRESQRHCKSEIAAFSAVMSCLITDVSSWISTAGSSNIEVRFATAKHCTTPHNVNHLLLKR